MKSYPFLSVTHQAAIESSLRNHEVITEKLAIGLYQTCFSVLMAVEVKADGIMTSKVEGTDYILATATDVKTGFYVQLARATALKTGDAILTIGQKFAQEKLTGGHQGAVHQFLYW